MTAPSATVQAVPRPYASRRNSLHQRYDLWLAAGVLTLLALGLVMVASASISTADRQLGEPLYFFWRQSIYVTLGGILAWGVLQVDLETWERNGPLLLIFGIFLLALVLVPGVGREVNGSTRWIRIGPVNLQPSEPVKLFIIAYMAGYLVRRGLEVQCAWTGFSKPMVVLAIIAGLLLAEPDYGATVVLFAAVLGMLFLAGVPLRSFFTWTLVLGGLLGAVIAAAPYRLERLMAFVNPWEDPFGSGFQLTQALIAIGRGEWFGVGLGSGVQKLFYLPEAHTDFIFAVLAEELGLAGASLVICLFAFVVWRAFGIAYRAQAKGQDFGAYMAYGLGLLLGLQAFINIGVNMGALPTKGLTLPFMSYGGSSAVVSCLALGLLLRVDYETKRIPKQGSRGAPGAAKPASRDRGIV